MLWTEDGVRVGDGGGEANAADAADRRSSSVRRGAATSRQTRTTAGRISATRRNAAFGEGGGELREGAECGVRRASAGAATGGTRRGKVSRVGRRGGGARPWTRRGFRGGAWRPQVDGERETAASLSGEEGVPGRAGDGGRLRDDVGGVRGARAGEIGRGRRSSRAAAREDRRARASVCPQRLRSTAAGGARGGAETTRSGARERSRDVRSRRRNARPGARTVRARGAARTASARANGSPMPEEDGANGCGAGGERGRASRVDERSADTVPARRRRRVR